MTNEEKLTLLSRLLVSNEATNDQLMEAAIRSFCECDPSLIAAVRHRINEPYNDDVELGVKLFADLGLRIAWAASVKRHLERKDATDE